MQFSWLKSFWKGAQALLEVAAAAAIVAGLDKLLSMVDEATELTGLGLPTWSIAPTLFLVRVAVNWWKVRRAGLAAGQLVR
jgi:hypothetical protein